jgi:hypothetical protein
MQLMALCFQYNSSGPVQIDFLAADRRVQNRDEWSIHSRDWPAVASFSTRLGANFPLGTFTVDATNSNIRWYRRK